MTSLSISLQPGSGQSGRLREGKKSWYHCLMLWGSEGGLASFHMAQSDLVIVLMLGLQCGCCSAFSINFFGSTGVFLEGLHSRMHYNGNLSKIPSSCFRLMTERMGEKGAGVFFSELFQFQG